MSDIQLDEIRSGYNLSKINSNFTKLGVANNNTVLHRAGGNNTMEQQLDMNSNRVINVSTPVDDKDAATKSYVDEELAGVESLKDEAELARDIAQAAANYQGEWFVGATVLKGQSWSYNGLEYVSKVNGAGEPIEGSDWLLISKGDLTLKIFQSPTNNLTKVTTFASGVGVVYEVRKTSDNSLATIYSDKDGVTEIPQNGTSNISNGDAECVFYIEDLPEELKIEIGSISANFKNYLFSVQSNERKLENMPDVKDFASVGDAVSSVLSDKLDLKITGNDNTINSGLSVTDYLNLSGNGFNNSKITATLTEDEAALSVVNGFNIKGINLASGDSLKGIGISSGNNQVAFNSYSDSAINGFKYAIWHRKSLWNSYKNLNLGGNICGIRLDRADYTAGNSNPESPSGWNIGWFNNQLTFDNVLVDGSGGGEVGIWACGMGMTFNSVTCQDILTDGTANKVLPSGQVGTGLIIDAGTDSGKNGWNNKVINYYAENVGVGIHAKGQKFLSIDSAFVQGKAGETKNAVLAERSIVTVSGLVGQDSFTDGVVKAIDESTVYVNNLIGPVIGTKFVADATSDIKLRGEKDKDLNDYHCNGTGTPGEVFTFPEVVPPNGFVTLRFVGLNDGFSVRVGTARLYNWNNASTSVVVWENGTPPSAVTVAVSNGGVITMTYNSSQVLQGRVQIVQEGGYGISSTGQTLTPV